MARARRVRSIATMFPPSARGGGPPDHPTTPRQVGGAARHLAATPTEDPNAMNLVALIGNLASDPELRYTPNGRAVCTFRLAVSRPGGEQADFFNVVAWERQAEVCHEYLEKGRRVGVDGRLHHSTWQVDGEPRSKVEVIASRVQMLGGPRPARDGSDTDTGGEQGDPASEGGAHESAARGDVREPAIA